MQIDELVHRGGLGQRPLEDVPVGPTTSHMVVREVLQKVEHALGDGVRALEAGAQPSAPAAFRVDWCLPCRAQLPFDVLAVEDVAEQ